MTARLCFITEKSLLRHVWGGAYSQAEPLHHALPGLWRGRTAVTKTFDLTGQGIAVRKNTDKEPQTHTHKECGMKNNENRQRRAAGREAPVVMVSNNEPNGAWLHPPLARYGKLAGGFTFPRHSAKSGS